VRELERMVARICRKVTRVNTNGKTQTASVEPSNVENYLGIPPFKENLIEQGDRIGSAVGLAWTSLGGEILNIQATLMPGKGNILLTGRLGDVMKESAQAAMSFLRSHAREWGVPDDLLQQCDIHVHIPEGATPKDGPSAGITLATSLLSAIIGQPVPGDVALTGEITLRGHVLAVGGLAEKTMAARRAGIRKMFIPAHNRVDWFDLDNDLREGMEVEFIENVQEVWNEIFPKELIAERRRNPRIASRESAPPPAM
jgi:ATP-dependent Lon protease